MWLPESAEEIERLATDGSLEETHHFDAKERLGRNRDVAIDVCAMTADGGTLLYGVGEDDEGRPTRPEPFELAGERERIDQIAATSIYEPPTIVVTERALAGKPSRGYLVVNVAQSARAPHQVVVGNDLRFYGRGATGNRILTEPDVAALYARREQWEVDREGVLDEVVGAAPHARRANYVWLHAFARPLAPDGTMLRRALGDDEFVLRNALVKAANTVRLREGGVVPSLGDQRDWDLHGAEGIVIGDVSDYPRAIRMAVDHDGRTTFFACAGLRSTPEDRGGGRMLLYLDVIAENLANFLAASGAFYGTADYVGNVDVGVALNGTTGAVRPGYEDHRAFPQDEYRETDRALAAELTEAPRRVAERLLQRFFDAMLGFGGSAFA